MQRYAQNSWSPRNVKMAAGLAGLMLVGILSMAWMGHSMNGGVAFAAGDANNRDTLSRTDIEEVVRLQVHTAVQNQIAEFKSMGGRLFPPVKKLDVKDQKRILVTGGAGFVGSNLVDVLMAQGHIVYVLDNLFTGRRKNIQHWEGHPNFMFYMHDVVEPFMIEVDQIYHLACPASPPQYQYNPIKTIKTSTMGTLNMLGLAKRVRARMLFTSTSEIYGDPEEHPQKEGYWGHVNIQGPRSCYDEGKRVAETMCYSYSREGGVEVRIARIFNTFGPRMHPDDGRVVSNFIIQALKGKDITVYGDGKQTRSFQYVSDLVHGLIRLMNSDCADPVNIGNPDEYTIKDFADKIVSKIPNGNSKVVHLPATKDDPSRRKPDITRAKERIGWQPEVPVDAGLEKTIRYFRQELGMLKTDEEEEVVYIS